MSWRVMPRSLRWRLVIVFVLFATAATGVFLHGMREMLHAGWHGVGRPMVDGTVDLMLREIGTPPDPARAEALTRRMPLVIRIDGPTVHWESSNTPPVQHQVRFGSRAASGPDGPYLITRHLADGHVVRFGLAAEPFPGHDSRAALTTLGTLLLLVVAAYAYVRWLFRPLEDIREGAARFGRGEFAHRIPAKRGDELGDLARRINTMGAEIGQRVDAQHALLMAISHELRSPLTRARVNAELVDDGRARDALLRDLGEMRDLIEDLLERERLASGHAQLLREPVDLAALAAEVLAAHFPGRDVRIAADPSLAPVAVDRLRVRLLLRNLVENALRHGTPPGAPPPELSLTPKPGGGATLVVRDFGPGVPPDDLPRLSEPFYRPDPARGRATGGVGLGLTLCRLVVEAHGGAWRLENAAPGLRIEATLA